MKKDKQKKALIYAPKAYWALSPAAKAEICNGCGPGKLGGILVPDTLYGLSVTEACDAHDFMYHTGETIEDKQEADRTFLNNMLRIIDANTSWKLLRWLRTRRAYKYYEAVRDIGGPKYWHGKNPEGTEQEV